MVKFLLGKEKTSTIKIINKKTRSGEAPLHIAAKKGNYPHFYIAKSIVDSFNINKVMPLSLDCSAILVLILNYQLA